MNSITVNLDGIPIEIKRLKISLKQLILDIENPRIQYYLDTKLNDNVTQEKIKFALAEGNEQHEKLKDHIERNGGIYDPIWVVLKENYYTVIEGNTLLLLEHLLPINLLIYGHNSFFSMAVRCTPLSGQWGTPYTVLVTK